MAPKLDPLMSAARRVPISGRLVILGVLLCATAVAVLAGVWWAVLVVGGVLVAAGVEIELRP